MSDGRYKPKNDVEYFLFAREYDDALLIDDNHERLRFMRKEEERLFRPHQSEAYFDDIMDISLFTFSKYEEYAVDKNQKLGMFNCGSKWHIEKRRLQISIILNDIFKKLEYIDNCKDKIKYLISQKHEIWSSVFDFLAENVIFGGECNDYIMDKIQDKINELKGNINSPKEYVPKSTEYVHPSDTVEHIYNVLEPSLLGVEQKSVQSIDHPLPQSTKKIQWNGNTNTLGTLFEVMRENGLIQSNRKELCRMIVNSFVDKDGNELKENYLYSTMRGSTDGKGQPMYSKDITTIETMIKELVKSLPKSTK